ncbi:MAG: MBL fold metallo-hydrolase [Verrucomicrobiota bacterium]
MSPESDSAPNHHHSSPGEESPLRSRRGILRNGFGIKTNGLQVGLKPERGWARRNYRFVRHRLLGTALQRREKGEHHGRRRDFHVLGEHEIEVTWIGHASFLVRTPLRNILIDPNWALWHGPVKRARHPGCLLEHLPPIDLVLITHAHFDHLHRPSLKAIANGQTVLVPQGVGKVLKRLQFSKVREMHNWELHLDEGLEVVFTPSHHWGARMAVDTHRGFGGFIIKTPHASLYHSGDSAYFGGFKEIGERHAIDTALLPIGAYESPSGRDVHMNPEEAIKAFGDLGARQMIPMHYGHFPLGNEGMHEPLHRLQAAAQAGGLSERVIVPPEGAPVLV